MDSADDILMAWVFWLFGLFFIFAIGGAVVVAEVVGWL